MRVILLAKPSEEPKAQEVKEEKADKAEPGDQQTNKKLPEPPTPKVRSPTLWLIVPVAESVLYRNPE